MFNTAASVGRRFRKLRSYSQASATKNRPAPTRQGPPSCGTVAPTMKLGSSPAATRAWAIIAVVVLLPCVPATATPHWAAINSPSIRLYLTHRTPAASAASSSGLASWMAAE